MRGVVCAKYKNGDSRTDTGHSLVLLQELSHCAAVVLESRHTDVACRPQRVEHRLVLRLDVRQADEHHGDDADVRQQVERDALLNANARRF